MVYRDLVQFVLLEVQVHFRTAYLVGFFGSDPYLDWRLFVEFGVAETAGKCIIDVQIEASHHFFQQSAGFEDFQFVVKILGGGSDKT